MGNSIVTVELGQDKFRTKCTSGKHVFYVDEPGSLGGDDTAPTPYDLLLGSLGACKAITVKMYAQRKEWDLQSVRVDLEPSRPNGRGKPEHIDLSLTFTGDLDDTQRARLKEIANACPVQKTILGEIMLDAVLED